jgi:hypothetical protein
MAIGDLYQIRFVSFDTDQIGLNIRHYVATASVAPEPSRVQIADFFTAAFAPTMQTMLNANAIFKGCDVRQLLPPPATIADHTTAAQVPGLVATPAAPRQVSGLIKLSTPLAGRAGRGRFYMPFPATTSVQADGAMGPAYFVNLGTLATKLNQGQTIPNGGGSLTLFPVIFHRKTGTFTLVTGTVARQGWATQRRRGFFGRINVQPW